MQEDRGKGQNDMRKIETSSPKGRSATEEVSCHSVPEAITSSWQRCLRFGLDPRGVPTDVVLAEQDLAEALETSHQLLTIVQPELELLSSQIAGTNHMIAFADPNGVILKAILDTEFQASEWAGGIRPGSIWREDLRGTNALGLALHTGQTGMVTGSEHFFAHHARIACVAAPIFGSDGNIVGLLDASSEVMGRQQHTRALIDLAAINIENRLFAEMHRTDNLIQFHPRREYLATQSTGLVAFDGAGRLTGANRRASRILAGQALVKDLAFGDLFEGGFEEVMRELRQGEIIQLTDWLRSSYFGRLRPSARPVGQGTSRMQAIPNNAPAKLKPVFDDDLVRESLRVIRAMQEVNQPVCISGAVGVGKNTLAEHVP